MTRYDFAVVGGGIVGLTTALALCRKHPRASMLVLEKEDQWAHHQTGHNSGVIHSGIYYTPGSLKAQLAREGNRTLVAFCQEHGIAHEICGKVIVATQPAELPRLDRLFQRGLENGIPVEKLRSAEVREREPHVACLAGLLVPTAGIVDFKAVCLKIAEIVRSLGGTLRLSCQVHRVFDEGEALVLPTNRGEFRARYVIACAGLQSDRLAKASGVNPQARIIPFRGEYYELAAERRHLVKHLVYPVPDPAFPFLGVHFTRMIDGSIHAGPNAVLSFKREGYRKTDFSFRDVLEVVAFPAFWKMAGRHWRTGCGEMWRSFSKGAFLRSLRRLIPEVQKGDLVPSATGVRAQALKSDGKLVDDFLLVPGRRSMHVCNAPSPAATACFSIAEAIVKQLPDAPRDDWRTQSPTGSGDAG